MTYDHDDDDLDNPNWCPAIEEECNVLAGRNRARQERDVARARVRELEQEVERIKARCSTCPGSGLTASHGYGEQYVEGSTKYELIIGNTSELPKKESGQ